MRIKEKPLRQYPWYLRPFFWHQKRKYKTLLKSSLLWAFSPRLFLGAMQLYGAFLRKKSPLSASLRNLILLRVAQLNECAFCLDLNARLRLEKMLPEQRRAEEEKLLALLRWHSSALFSEKERAALDYTERITLSYRQVSQAAFERLSQHFSEAAVIELTALISFSNMTTKFNKALAVPDQGLCRLPRLMGQSVGRSTGRVANRSGGRSAALRRSGRRPGASGASSGRFKKSGRRKQTEVSS